MSDVVLRVENLSVALPPGADRPFAVEDLSLEVRRGEILCVVGESGSGKSVLANAVMGYLARGLRFAAGRIAFGGEDLTRLPEKRLRALRGRQIAMVFQEPMASLNPTTAIGEQIAEVFAIHAPDMPVGERQARARALLRDVNLLPAEDFAARLPHELSGGQCQRVVIAMAIAMKPALLLADEPTTALDVTTQAQIVALLRDLKEVHGHAILFVTHDFGLVADIADRVAVMKDGRLVELGTAAEILAGPQHPYTRRLLAAVPDAHPAPRAPVSAPPALTISRLSKSYGIVKAVDDVSIDVPAGSTLAIVGESGSGKSTLARSVIRLVEPSGGRIVVHGADFQDLSGSALTKARRSIQMVFQDPFGSLNPQRSVGAVLRRSGRLAGLGRRDAEARARELIELVGLKPEALARKPAAFSGGQRQRIGIARALALDPDILIADESVSALDVSVQKQILDLLDELKKRRGLTLVFITHDLRVAAEIADEIVVMRRGRVVERGSTVQILTRPGDPYTAELVGAMPGRGVDFRRAAASAGQPEASGQGAAPC